MSESHLASIGSQSIERLVQFRVKPEIFLRNENIAFHQAAGRASQDCFGVYVAIALPF
jgi:hypothetical protein